MAAFAIFVANEILSSITVFYRYITVEIIIKIQIRTHFCLCILFIYFRTIRQCIDFEWQSGRVLFL